MDISVINNKFVLTLGNKIYELNTWLEVEQILKEHVEKLKEAK